MNKSERVRNSEAAFNSAMHRASAMLLLVLLSVLTSCSLLRTPQKVVEAVVPARTSQPDLIQLQIKLQRFSDDFGGRTTQALDEYAEKTGTEQGRILALQLKLRSLSAMISVISGPNPNANLLDVVTMNTLTRRMVEDHWMKSPGGQHFGTWLENARILETNAWGLAATVLKPEQIQELRTAINDWYERNPQLRDGFLARPHELVGMMATEHKGTSINSVFSFVGIDPTIGLDPAVREITQTRLFAERAMFTFQRMPFLLRFQTELLAYQLVAIPEVRLVLTNTVSISESAERISRTTAELPELITTERKAILAAMEQQEGKLRELSESLNQTLISGKNMSTSLNTTLTTFDALMKRFGVGEPDTNSVPDNTNSPPFNILDYGKVAGQISGMAKEVNTLLTTANQNVTQLTQLSDNATQRVDRAVDRAFHRGILLIVIFLVGSVLAALTYRALSRKNPTQ
jgi:hypothetical protein